MGYRIAALILSASLLSGCVTAGASQCDGWRRIQLTKNDVRAISDKAVESILAHNEYGKKQGCWK